MNILILSDIHANYPALQSIIRFLQSNPVDSIINAGDSVVYGPYPNETLDWLQFNNTYGILGNTDKKVIKLLRGKSFKKPRKEEKRVMYTWTAKTLTPNNSDYLRSLPTSTHINLSNLWKGHKKKLRIDIFHGSPARDHEFLFIDTPNERFLELSSVAKGEIVIVGHSHTPFYKFVGNTHFINPGSVGRMFDGIVKSSFAILSLGSAGIQVHHYRLNYDVKKVTEGLLKNELPTIYQRMFREGRKLN